MKKWEEYLEKAHAKNPNDYRCARIKIYAPDESDLHEITLTYMKTLDHNGAWDFEIEHIDKDNMNIVSFKYNGTITALDAISKLHFHCEHSVKWKFIEQ
ncbi:MAG: hypothetical protein K2J88_07225 [Oscillospiraceae bacterium]|nr:hypothetical protein [Oscillospiraceae bacterium]